MTVNRVRFSGIFDLSRTHVTVIGTGGIGSYLCHGLAKSGVASLTIFDDDVVDDENVGTQFYRASDIGISKVAATCQSILQYSPDTTVYPFSKRVTFDEDFTNQIMISAVDSIKSRQDIWRAILHMYPSEMPWYIDTRMAAEELQFYCINEERANTYDELLMELDEEDVPDLPCTEKATSYTGMIAGGVATNMVRRIAMGMDVPMIYQYFLNKDALVVVG